MSVSSVTTKEFTIFENPADDIFVRLIITSGNKHGIQITIHNRSSLIIFHGIEELSKVSSLLSDALDVVSKEVL